MAKAAKSSFVCQSCGAVASRWAGKCASCGDWNTIVEEAGAAAPPGSGIMGATKGRALQLETLAGAPEETVATLGEFGREIGDEEQRLRGRAGIARERLRNAPERRSGVGSLASA